jgi:hypothetical protein
MKKEKKKEKTITSIIGKATIIHPTDSDEEYEENIEEGIGQFLENGNSDNSTTSDSSTKDDFNSL